MEDGVNRMLIERMVVGSLEVNCFIIADEHTREAMVVDPGDEPERILDYVNEKGLTIKKIIYTHSHFDHVGALPELKDATGAELLMHSDELPVYEASRDMAALWGFQLDTLPKPTAFLAEGDTVTVGSLTFTVLHTPGHSPGGICLYGEDVLITGDTLFAGSVGRTDLQGGDLEKLKESFRRILALPEGIRVLPGHGPETTIGQEKVSNFFASEFLT